MYNKDFDSLYLKFIMDFMFILCLVWVLPIKIFYEIINFKPYNIILYNITKTLIFNVQICSLLCKYQSHNSLK